MNPELVAALVLGALVTASLAWLARHLSGVARRSAPGRQHEDGPQHEPDFTATCA